MSRYVLDNTVTMAWCFTEEATDFYAGVVEPSLKFDRYRGFVPVLWLYEVVNVVELARRKGRITNEKAAGFLEGLSDLPIEVETPSRVQMFTAVRALAAQHQLTSYDAAYLELSIRHNLPIASLDGKLSRAAVAEGVNAAQV